MDVLASTHRTLPDHMAPSLARCEVIASPTIIHAFPYTLAAALFILLWIILNLAYLAFFCPHDLAPDEAHYWQWSRHLDWSYYSKGPLIAWMIRSSCELFGDTMFAVRLPAVFCSAALLAGLYVLIADVLQDRGLALAAIMCVSSLPGVSAAAALMTIDPPFLACWCWALVSLNRALRMEAARLRWWLLAGFLVAFGILAKYTMLLLPAAAIVHLLVNRRTEFRRSGVWLFLGVAALGGLPILIWNANHDWLSFRHVMGQAGANPKSSISWHNPFAYIGAQMGLLIGFWFLAFAAGVWRYRKSSDSGLSLVWWTSVPVWGAFLAVSVATPGQANWPAAAYIGGGVLAAAWIRDQLAGSYRRLVLVSVINTTIAGIGLSHWLRFPQVARPALARLVSEPTDAKPTPVRALDPSSRLHGWRTLATEIDRLRDRVKLQSGEDPVIAGMVWTIPGELSFYCREHPTAYSFGSALADRHSQFDLWRPNPLSDPERFRGRTFLYVGKEIPNAAAIFDRVEPPIHVVHRETGIPIATWTIWICHGYRGFPEVRTRSGY